MKVNLEVQCESNIMRENTIAAQKIIQIFLVVMIICNIKRKYVFVGVENGRWDVM